MIYDVKFSDLFDNERQAVVCYLSLEKRYMQMCKLKYDEMIERLIELDREEASRINSGINWRADNNDNV